MGDRQGGSQVPGLQRDYLKKPRRMKEGKREKMGGRALIQDEAQMQTLQLLKIVHCYNYYKYNNFIIINT